MHEPKLIHDAGQRERIEGGLDSSKRRNRDPPNHAHKSHITEKKHDKKYVTRLRQVRENHGYAITQPTLPVSSCLNLNDC